MVEKERFNKSSVEYTSVSGVEVSSVSSASEENLPRNGLSEGDEILRGEVASEVQDECVENSKMQVGVCQEAAPVMERESTREFSLRHRSGASS